MGGAALLFLLMPACPPAPGIAISSLSVSQATCAVGSEDGYLRLWPLDFSSVLLEAGGAKTVPCHCGHHGRATSLGHLWVGWQSRALRGCVLSLSSHHCQAQERVSLSTG